MLIKGATELFPEMLLNDNEDHTLNWSSLHVIVLRVIEIISKIWNLYEWIVM